MKTRIPCTAMSPRGHNPQYIQYCLRDEGSSQQQCLR